MERIHEEFIMILKEKHKYEKMKKNARNVNEKLEEKTGNMRLNDVNSSMLKDFSFCIHKMYLTSAHGYTNLGVHFLSIKKLMKFGQV